MPARSPRELASLIIEALRKDLRLTDVEVAGPGFINMRLRATTFHALLPDILRVGEGYGDSVIGNGTRINVEYVSANPTGPMHIGHCRGAVVGDALANLLIKAGYDVTKDTTSTMLARRSPRSRGRRTGATCKRSARRSAKRIFPTKCPAVCNIVASI